MPYTHKKVGTKFVVYKKGKKVGETEGTKTALNKYLAALHIADKKTTKKESVKESITMQQPVTNEANRLFDRNSDDKVAVWEKGYKRGYEDGRAGKAPVDLAKYRQQIQAGFQNEGMMGMPNYEHPGCEDTVGDIFVVMKPGPEDTPEKLVQPTHAFGMHQFDPMQVHGVYNDQEEANMVAESACNELYKHMKEVEDKKHNITTKIEGMIRKMQKEVNRCMQRGDEGTAQMMLEKISSLRERHKMVETSKQEIKPLEEKK